MRFISLPSLRHSVLHGELLFEWQSRILEYDLDHAIEEIAVTECTYD
jgi:hypothetical protein